MPRCRFCDQANPPEATRCASCGAELPVAPSDPAGAAMAPDDRAASSEDSLERRVLDLLSSQGKIAAIKEYRERTGAGLKEAKDAVEALAARHGMQSAQRAGCGAVLVAVALMIAMAVLR